MTSYEVIYLRKSVRNFKMTSIDNILLNGLIKYAENFVPIYPDIKVRFEIMEYLDGKALSKGMFHIKAPYYMALYSEKKMGYLANAGCLMEQMAVRIAALGFGTCYIGRLHKNIVEDGEEKLAVFIAFGSASGDSLRKSSQAKRYQMKALLLSKAEPAGEMKSLLEAARMAPSSMNSQPWRFLIHEQKLHIFKKKNNLQMWERRRWQEVDMGVMLAHIIIVAEELWIDISMKRLETMLNKEYGNKEYFLTVVIRPYII